MSRGYLIYAVDEPYISKAQTLKKSIEHHTSDDATIISGNFPYGDITKEYNKNTFASNLLNLWQLYWATPYDETIVLDADMLFLNDYSYWWDYLSKFDLLFELISIEAIIFLERAFTTNKRSNRISIILCVICNWCYTMRKFHLIIKKYESIIFRHN